MKTDDSYLPADIESCGNIQTKVVALGLRVKTRKRVASGSPLCCLYKTMYFEGHQNPRDITLKIALCICVIIHFFFSLKI